MVHLYANNQFMQIIGMQLTLWEPFVLRFRPKKTAVFGCLTNALAPPLIALQNCSRVQTDRPV